MTIEVSPTELRKNIYKLLDHVLDSGEPIEIQRKGRRLRIMPAVPESRLDRLEPHPGCMIGDPEEFVHLDWSKEWKPVL